MPRKFLVALAAVAFLAAPTFVPATMTGVSGSALAQSTDAVNLNASRSNIYRMGGGPGKTTGSTNKIDPGKKKTDNLQRGRNLNSSRSN